MDGHNSFDHVAIVPDQAAARATVDSSPTTIALVARGVLRSALFKCPCGCDETLSINLDPASARAWRIHVSGSEISLLPSVWRTSGCRSHFFLWRNQIWWCSDDDDELLGDDADIQLWDSWFRTKFSR
jgi:hypothetical protein